MQTTTQPRTMLLDASPSSIDTNCISSPLPRPILAPTSSRQVSPNLSALLSSIHSPPRVVECHQAPETHVRTATLE